MKFKKTPLHFTPLARSISNKQIVVSQTKVVEIIVKSPCETCIHPLSDWLCCVSTLAFVGPVSTGAPSEYNHETETLALAASCGQSFASRDQAAPVHPPRQCDSSGFREAAPIETSFPRKCPGIFLPQSVNKHYFRSDLISVDPICPQPRAPKRRKSAARHRRGGRGAGGRLVERKGALYLPTPRMD